MTIDRYIENCSDQEPDILQDLVRQTHLRALQPRMLSGHLQGRLLSMLCSIIAPTRVLELGTFTGYATICLAQSMVKTADAKLITIDIDDELESISADFFARSGCSEIIEQRFDDAKTVIKELEGSDPFDLVFIDADKRDYLAYYQLLFDCKLVKHGSVILADNTLWSGKVLSEVAANDAQTSGIVAFNEFVKNDPKVSKVLLPLRDGLTIIRVL